MVGQKPRNDVAGCFWLRVSEEVFVQMSSGLQAEEDLKAGSRMCFPDGSLTDMAGSWCWLLAKAPD